MGLATRTGALRDQYDFYCFQLVFGGRKSTPDGAAFTSSWTQTSCRHLQGGLGVCCLRCKVSSIIAEAYPQLSCLLQLHQLLPREERYGRGAPRREGVIGGTSDSSAGPWRSFACLHLLDLALICFQWMASRCICHRDRQVDYLNCDGNQRSWHALLSRGCVEHPVRRQSRCASPTVYQ